MARAVELEEVEVGVVALAVVVVVVVVEVVLGTGVGLRKVQALPVWPTRYVGNPQFPPHPRGAGQSIVVLPLSATMCQPRFAWFDFLPFPFGLLLFVVVVVVAVAVFVFVNGGVGDGPAPCPVCAASKLSREACVRVVGVGGPRDGAVIFHATAQPASHP